MEIHPEFRSPPVDIVGPQGKPFVMIIRRQMLSNAAQRPAQLSLDQRTPTVNRAIAAMHSKCELPQGTAYRSMARNTM